MYKIEDFEKKKKRTLIILKIFNILIYIVIVPIIIYNLTLIVKYFINPKETPDFLGYKTFEIISKSMEKTINVNDIIFVKEVLEEEIRVNDIISFNINGEIITHRIIKIENNNGKMLYTTKGDNNKAEDKQKLVYNQIEGKYIFKIPKLGYFMNFLKNSYVLFLLLLILIMCLIHIIKVKQRKKIRREKNKVKILD